MSAKTPRGPKAKTPAPAPAGDAAPTTAARKPRAAKAREDASPSEAAQPMDAPPPVVPVMPADEAATDPVPVGVRQLLEVFAGPLAEVRFPDVDAERLEAACQTLRAADGAVRQALVALEAAQTALADQEMALVKLAERGLAYAKVYGAEDEALQAKLAEVELGGRRGPRKGKAKMIRKADAPSRKKTPSPEPTAASESEAPRSAAS